MIVRWLATLSLLAAIVACDSPPHTVTMHDADRPPLQLSEWGVVLSRGDRLTLSDAVIPYELNAPLFSDYALKLRTIWMPDGESAGYVADAEFDFPVGTIISKTFYYQKADGWRPLSPRVVKADREAAHLPGGGLHLGDNMLIETRLLVRYADGWRAFPYVWNAAQTDATLEIAGDIRSIALVDDASTELISYVVPDANQCAACHTPDHTAGELRPLGPKAWQLNRDYAWWGDGGGQLEHWAARGLLRGLDAPPATVRWFGDDAADADARARNYLDANCAHCHNPAGAADTSALHLNRDAPLDRHFGICKPPVAVGRGSGDRPYDIYPGRPDDSIVVFRMQHSDPAIAMPELGRSAIHGEGVAAISAWIAAMSGAC